MTQDEIIRIAQQAGFNLAPTQNMLFTVRGNLTQIARFAVLVAASEREACAELAYALRFKSCWTAEAIAAAIRSRNVDSVDAPPECVEKTMESIHDTGNVKSLLISDEISTNPTRHRYAGRFSE